MPRAPGRRDTSQSPEVARLVRLHHRRRGWAWVATSSAIGLAAYAALDVSLFGSSTGTAGTLTAIPVFALVALVLAGLADVIVDTSRLHRAHAPARVTAQGSVSHYPWYAHAHRWPPRHPASWVAAIFMLVAMTSITAYNLPAEVNAWAYVAGAASQDTFSPVSYHTSCGLSRGHGISCQTVTEGYLSRSGAQVYWGPQVSLGKPFSVRDPIWAWGTGRYLISGDGSAIPTIVAGLFFDGIALLILYILVVIMRETAPSRGHPKPSPAGADPGGVRRTQHPGSGNPGSDRRRRARRGRGRRRSARRAA